MALTDQEIEALETRANEIRQSVIKILVEAGSGHTAGPLGMAESLPPFISIS
jgi:transketolase